MAPIHLSPASSSCIKFHEEDPSSPDRQLCRRPMVFHTTPSAASSMPYLMTLKTFLGGGNEIAEANVLVCVRSIGPRKTINKQDRETADLVEITVFDETESCRLTLWEDKIASAKSWQPGRTILLLTDPKLRIFDLKGVQPEISIGFGTLVDVDPVFPDADWLRQMAANLTKKESVSIPFPETIWDAELVTGSQTLFTIADVDQRVRDNPDDEFIGNLSLVILDLAITENHRKRRLCCFEW